MKERSKQYRYASGKNYLEAVLVLRKERGIMQPVDGVRRFWGFKSSVCHAVITFKNGSARLNAPSATRVF